MNRLPPIPAPVRRFGTIAMFAILCGCGHVRQLAHEDLTSTGGVAGHFEDHYVMHAKSHAMIIYRDAELLAMLSSIAANTSASQDDNEYVVRSIVSANYDINYLYSMSEVDCKDTTTDIMTDGCAQIIEAYAPKIELDLIRIAKFALPTNKLRKLLSDIEKRDVAGAVVDLASVGGQAILDFHSGAADTRAGVEVVMESGSASVDTFQAAETAYSAAGDGVGWMHPGKNSINAMYNIVRDACNKIILGVPTKDLAHLDNLKTGDPPECNLKPAT